LAALRWRISSRVRRPRDRAVLEILEKALHEKKSEND
jgi:hypothetical protein